MHQHPIDELFLNLIASSPNIITLSAKEMEASMLLSDVEIPTELPILPLRGNVLFPGVILPINAGRKQSIKMLNNASKKDSYIGVVAQKNDSENPQREDLYDYGCVAKVMKVIEMPDGNSLGILQGFQRIRLLEIIDDDPCLMGTVQTLVEEDTSDFKGTVVRSKIALLRKKNAAILKANDIPIEAAQTLKGIQSNKILINFIASHSSLEVNDKQSLLDISSYSQRLDALLDALESILETVRIKEELQKKTRREMDRQQREYFLNQQMHVIQEELGGNPTDQEIQALEDRANGKKWSKDTRDFFDKEIAKLRRTPPSMPDYVVQSNYLSLMLDLQWNEYTTDNLNTEHARKVLDHDHFGMEKVKERILEHIAVLKLKGEMKSPILCLVGPPGTGKTSLGKSIATALGRKYVRIALGGLHDESEIRGHRKTYVGAMPGRIIQNIKKAQSANPVFILDEIDKIQTNTINGDPTSALLEVLDPEQNNAFHDNYLDLDFDLSKVMFIATANNLTTIQPALLDRMEIIDLSGYVMEEKIEIASRHLVPGQLADMGFSRNSIKFPKAVLANIINDYTRESGVRQLEKAIAKIIRCQAVKVAANHEIETPIKANMLKEYLGLPVRQSEHRGKESRVGVVTGLAWTSVGGEILFIESSISKGKGTLTMTGNLGDVMKESATLAFEYLKANAEAFSVDTELIENSNLHIHVPEGAVPKDGPSAGITMFVAMVSAFTRRKVKSSIAMTGEITLRGSVTPVGGIKEKMLAAKRADITDIILSEENRRDIEDINETYLKGLSFHYISEMTQALPLALES